MLTAVYSFRFLNESGLELVLIKLVTKMNGVMVKLDFHSFSAALSR